MKNLLRNYSIELTNQYGKGFDYTNLNRMRQLYLSFEKVGTPCQQLSWSHYRYILPIKEEGKRNYYINLVITNGLSVSELLEAKKNKSYERLTKFVLFELKINKLDIRDIGQIEFYINYYNDEIKKDYHNDTIGIIICKKNDKEVMKYNKNDNVLVTSYKIN